MYVALAAVAGIIMIFMIGRKDDGQLELLQRQIDHLQHNNTILRDSIRARDLLIDSLESKQIKADGVIVSLNKQVRVSKARLAVEKERVNNLTSHELQKEILDYYSTN